MHHTVLLRQYDVLSQINCDSDLITQKTSTTKEENFKGYDFPMSLHALPLHLV